MHSLRVRIDSWLRAKVNGIGGIADVTGTIADNKYDAPKL